MTDPTLPGPDDLDGRTIEELADYLDRGRAPADAGIEASPGCRRALAALERLRAVSADLVTDGADPPGGTAAWIDGVMRRIALDARAGADVVLARTADGDEVIATEGVLRGLVRAAGDDRPGLLVGRVRFSGPLDGTGPVAIELDLLVAWGVAIPAAVDALRVAVRHRIEHHTRVRAPRIDVVVRDVTAPEEPS